jgi:type IV pilus assembly protein PilC
MTLFHYKATSPEGIQYEADMDASDKFDLAHKLKKDGISIISAIEKNNTLGSMNIKIPFLGGVKAHDKIVFARNLGSMIEAGLPMTRALSIMEREGKGNFKEILKKIGEDVSTGKTLSESMTAYPKVFSELFVSMVKAGEDSGNLVSALKNVSGQMEKTYLLNKKVKGAMMYPAVIFSLMIVIGVLMMIYMVPTLSSTFVGLGVKLPLSTRIIIGMSNFLRSYILYIIPSVTLFVFMFVYFMRTKIGGRIGDFVALHMPIIGEVVKQVNAARTARTLSSLISSGVEIVSALKVTEEVLQNSYYKEVLAKTSLTIEKGEQISKIFTENSNLYPLFVGEMVSVGEETGKIGEMLLGVAEFYEEEVDQKTKDMSAIIEPFLMIFIGIAVGAFAISMLAPTYSLVDAI